LPDVLADLTGDPGGGLAMRKMLTPAILAGSLLALASLPAQALAQTEPLSISSVGLTCTNGVCDLGTGNVART
jgi:hypothetical protein